MNRDSYLRLAFAIALACGACNSTGGPTAPDSWLRVATKHGTVAVDPAADPARVVAAIEAGFARARTRTRFPEEKVDRYTVDGLVVVVGTWGRYHGPLLVEIQRGAEFSLAHEVGAHWLADKNGITGPCQTYQDHGDEFRDNPYGGCNLDGEWAR